VKKSVEAAAAVVPTKSAHDVTLLDPEICALATLAACFANIHRGMSKTAQIAQTMQQEAHLGVAGGAESGGVADVADGSVTGAAENISQPVPNLEEFGAQLRQVHILRFDYYWAQLQAAGARMSDQMQSQPRSLATLCALSDYYAAMSRGLNNAARVRSGLLSDEEACTCLADVLLNGSTTVQTSQGYPTVDDAVIWERWDTEPVNAFRWFKLYLRMQEKFGFRDFAHFQIYLQRGTQGIVAHTSKTFATPVDALCSLSVEGMENGVAEVLDEELGISSSLLAVGVLNPSSAVNRQELLRIRAYYHLFYWDLRVTQYDKWERAMLRRRSERRTAYLMDEQYAVFADVFGRVRERVIESANLLSPNDAVKALQDIAKMLRLTAGYSADKPINAARGGGMSDVAMISAESSRGYDVEINEAGDSSESDNEALGLRPQLVVNFIKSPHADVE